MTGNDKLPERMWCSYPDCPCERENDGICQYTFSRKSLKVPNENKPLGWDDTAEALREAYEATSSLREKLRPTDSLYEELRQWQAEARNAVTPMLGSKGSDCHAARLVTAIQEINDLRCALQTIRVIASSHPHRESSGQGYGDIEALCDVALSLRV